jgi:hypothetical protein
MPVFENYPEEAQQLELEILRKGVVLDIDWDDEAAVAQLAREALAYHPTESGSNPWPRDPAARARIEMFGLVQLMLKVMAESASEDIHTHGGPTWKALGRALWRESGQGDGRSSEDGENSESA